MILAAGEGRRMRPLTLTTPKPLLTVGNKTLIEHHIHRLRNAGIVDILVNTAYLGDMIHASLGDGADLGVNIVYSKEPAPLETGGALNRALSQLGTSPFILINGDVWCDYPLAQLAAHRLNDALAHLVLVDNPLYHPKGDFILPSAPGLITGFAGAPEEGGLTFSGVSLINPRLIIDFPHKRDHFPLREVFQWAISLHALTAEFYSGDWCDVGTPERLTSLRGRVATKSLGAIKQPAEHTKKEG